MRSFMTRRGNKLLSMALGVGLVLASNAEGSAQTVLQVQDGFLYTPQQDFIYVNGDVGVTEGKLDHNGTLEFTGNWSNTSQNHNEGFDPASTGLVKMVGAAQDIQGYTSTTFPSLSLEGYDTKRLAVNSKVAHDLNLNNIELNVNGNEMWVANNETTAITRTTGFVNTSTAPLGKLVLTVKAGNTYSYPLAGGVDYRYRPVTAVVDEDGVLAAQFQNYDANTDGYDRMHSVATNFNVINDKFYHVVTSVSGAGNADIIIPYSSVDDGQFNGLARWADGHWADAMYHYNAAAAGQGTDMAMHYHLANGGTHILALTDTISDKGTADNIFVVSGFTPNGDGKNDYFAIKGLENYKFNEIKIFNRWGNMVYTTISYKNDWAGNGLDMGTYMYSLRVVDMKGKERIITGDVTLIR